MSRNTIILLILLVPLGIWLNLYAYYKYGKSLIKKLPTKKNRQNAEIVLGEKKGIENKGSKRSKGSTKKSDKKRHNEDEN